MREWPEWEGTSPHHADSWTLLRKERAFTHVQEGAQVWGSALTSWVTLSKVLGCSSDVLVHVKWRTGSPWTTKWCLGAAPWARALILLGELDAESLAGEVPLCLPTPHTPTTQSEPRPGHTSGQYMYISPSTALD